MTEERTLCPPAETLAEFVEGKLDRRRTPEILAHLETCETCMTALELASEEAPAAATEPRRTPTAWLALAALFAGVAITALLLMRPWRSPIDRLVAAAPRSARVIEPRLAGGFAWAAYRGPLRETDASSDPARLRLIGAAADAVERGDADASAEAQHAAGVALVLIDDPLAAIAHLRAAAESAPNDPKTWSDLAAAEYAAAMRLGRKSFYPDALGHAERALRIDPRFAEALFNRALVLERLGLADEARAAWTTYLEVDGASPWAAEAREHLAQLPSTSAAAQFDADQRRLEDAAMKGDAGTVAEIAGRHRERARAFGEVEYLGRWAEAMRSGRPDEAARWLTISRAIGDALAQISGESLLRDAVHAVDVHGIALADAHLAYRRGRIAYSRQKPAEAKDDLRRAADGFAAAHDPLAFMARYYAANVRFDQYDVAGARAELEALARDLRAAPRYMAAAANVRWELALCHSASGDWMGAVASLAAAANAFERLGENSNLAAIENLRAAAFDVLGRPDDAWSARIRCLTMESRERRGDRLAGALATASAALIRAGKHDAAHAMMTIEERTLRAAGNEGLLVHALSRKAQLAAEMGDDVDAHAAADEALAVASRLPDPALRARETATAQLAMGAAELRRDPRKASAMLGNALAGFEAAGLHPRIAEAALLRARAAVRLGDTAAASRDIDAGIAALDRMRIPIGGGVAPGVYDAGTALFDEAVRLELARGDVAGALGYAERSRAQLDAAVVGAHELQQRLAGSGTVVLETFVTGADVISFAIDEHELRAVSRPLPGNDDASRYDALIRPFEAMVARARRVVIVPDPRLAAVPYAALTDGTRKLVERLPVAIAPSASALVRTPRVAPQSIAAMALPAETVVSLPESEREVADVTRLYPKSTVIAASLASLRAEADVLHIAGHTARDASNDTALLLGGTERAAWSTISATPLHARIVTLSACETLRDPAHAGRRALSLGAGFLAAGAHDVIGTLVPINDRDARSIFRDIHRQLAAGVEPSEAVRRAQLNDLAAGGRAWCALAVATNRIED